MKPTSMAPARLSLARAVIRPLTSTGLAAAVGGTGVARPRTDTCNLECPKSGVGSAPCPVNAD